MRIDSLIIVERVFEKRRFNPPNPLKKGAKIRILVPLFKGDLADALRSGFPTKEAHQAGGLTTYDRTFQTPSEECYVSKERCRSCDI
jgi:hypothetical protein